ncbi:nrd-1, partial [Pristionchus pacificus]
MERDVITAFNAELASIYDSRPPISKNKIVEITKTALKAIKFYKHVVFSVEKFLGKCKAEYKIPCLYVMDSILRQSKRQFKDKDVFCARFAKNFETTLVVLLQCSPTDRLKIARTINLWEANGVFSSEKINEYRAICVANGLEMDRDAVEKAVKGEKADLSIYERSGEKEKKERHHHHHHRHREEHEGHTPAEPAVEMPSEEVPSGGVSEAALLNLIQNQMFDIGQTVGRDLTLLRQVHSMIVQNMKDKVEKERNANKQVSVKKLLSSGFDYSDEEDNEEEKEEPKAPPPPTQDELDRMAESLVMEKAADIRRMHGDRIVKLQNAALEAKRAEQQRAAQDAAQAQQEKDAAVAQAQKMAAQQQAAAAAAAAAASVASSQAQVQSSILGQPPPGPPFGLPPGMQLPPGFPGLPQVSMAGPGGLSGLIQQNSLDNQMKALNSILSNPLGILGQGPPPQINLQHNPLFRMNPQFAALAGGGDQAALQALLSQPPPSLPPMGIPPPGMNSGLSQQQLQHLAGVGNGMGMGLGGSIGTSMNGPPSGMGGMGMHPQSMQPQGMPPQGMSQMQKPPSLMDLDQDVLAQMMAQAPPSDEMDEQHSQMERRESRESRDDDRDRRKKRDGERDRDRDRDRGEKERDRGDRGDRRDRDRDRDRSEHRSKDHKEKKRKRSRSRERRDRSRDREDDKERRKMGLPSHPKDGTTTIASCTVWLGRLPQMNEEELRASIPELSPANQVQLMHTRACAYVTMKDRRSAVKLLDKAKGMRVRGKDIKASWAAGNGTKGDKWRSYWDEDRGISAIPHNELPLDAMNDLCDGGWLDVSTLPIHLRGIIDEGGKVIDQTDSATSLLDDTLSSHHSNSFLDLGQVQLPPTPDLSSIPNPMSHFNPNMNLGGPALMMPPMGGQFMNLGLPNGLPPFVPSPMRGGMHGGRGGPGGHGGFMHSPMGGRGRGDWRGGSGRGGFMPRGGGGRGG